MRILATNDDGVHSEGLRALVAELSGIARVTVFAPDREQSAIGTAVTLRRPLRLQVVMPLAPGADTYSVSGTPSDSVILALGRSNDRIDLVVSGINNGLNLGEDVLISGTVGAALQGYLRGFPSMAISAPYDNHHLETAARAASLLARRVIALSLATNLFLNVNVPDLPAEAVRGVRLTRLAHQSHINTVEAGGGDSFRLVRQRRDSSINHDSDIWAVEQGYISVTPIYILRPERSPLHTIREMCADLYQEMKSQNT